MLLLPFCSKCNTARYTLINAERSRWACYGCRILKKIEKRKDGCWIWIGKTRNGYGFMHTHEGFRNAHRVAFAVWRHEVPDGFSVIHKCHSKLCCNPDHLKIKTQPKFIG